VVSNITRSILGYYHFGGLGVSDILTRIDLHAVLALLIVPAISLGIRAFGKYLRELSHKTQAAAAVAASIAEVEPSSLTCE
jgi:hypothetical protein